MPLSAKRAWPYLEAVASTAHPSSPFLLHLLCPPHCPLPCCWQICLFTRGNKLDTAQTSCLSWASVMNWVLEGSSRTLLLATLWEGRQQSSPHECTVACNTCPMQLQEPPEKEQRTLPRRPWDTFLVDLAFEGGLEGGVEFWQMGSFDSTSGNSERGHGHACGQQVCKKE